MTNIFTYGLLFFVMVIWGLNVVAIKVMVEHFPPLLITSLRILLAGLIIFFLLIFQKRLRALSRKEWFYTIAGSLLGMVGNQTLLSFGLMHTSASNAALILALVPLATSVLAVFFLGDRLTLLRVVGIFLALIGISFVVLDGSGEMNGLSIGTVYMFCAMLTQAFSFIFINKATKTVDPRQATAIMLTVGSLIMFVMSLAINPTGVQKLSDGSLWMWMLFLASSILAMATGQILYNTAIKRLGAGQTAIFMNLIPFFSLIGSVLFLGESVHLSQLFGFVFIATGVLFGTGYIDNKFIVRETKRKPVVKSTHT